MITARSYSAELLNIALDQNASDIHFCPSPTDVKIYFRIHGKRVFYLQMPLNIYQTLLNHFKFSAGMDIGESRQPQDGAITYEYNQRIVSLRLSTLPVSGLESLAIRLLPQNERISLNKLFLFPYQLSSVKEWISNQSGVILFTGATGSGKTTTLYALLQTLLEEQSYQTITLEDPVEKELQNLLQVQVNENSGVTYQAGLKAALRHDPDIIMVGEIRDQKTAQFVFHAAYTGHLVLSTLHAKNAIGTIYRLKEMGIKQSDLEQNLIAVAALELFPILIQNKISSRAAILELLDGTNLMEVIQCKKVSKNYQTFEQLKRKAVAYGFSK
ncbi:competence protein ComGA [Natronobacillus azotifigens]|uniref:Competence type IV pilus ATPase ComGA n=1 Tax=Natronobacillus azotifigens TaxID=472978 RepID=A0A9J6RF90_9BACI|nr:competence type IV pilus ATPase ComGA [Natronobacillus azotifigens]